MGSNIDRCPIRKADPSKILKRTETRGNITLTVIASKVEFMGETNASLDIPRCRLASESNQVIGGLAASPSYSAIESFCTGCRRYVDISAKMSKPSSDEGKRNQ